MRCGRAIPWHRGAASESAHPAPRERGSIQAPPTAHCRQPARSITPPTGTLPATCSSPPRGSASLDRGRPSSHAGSRPYPWTAIRLVARHEPAALYRGSVPARP
jgi:hypothetical protein